MLAVRFRKRYYIFYHRPSSPSYPEALGKRVVALIPTDAAKYQNWLAAERKSAEKVAALYEDLLSIKPGQEFTNYITKYMRGHFPSSLAPLNDTSIEWIYTFDLDRETFTVNNGAHFKLDQVPRIDWINSLANGGLGDKISLPGAVPMEAVTSLVIEHSFEGTVSDVCSSFRYSMCWTEAEVC